MHRVVAREREVRKAAKQAEKEAKRQRIAEALEERRLARLDEEKRKLQEGTQGSERRPPTEILIIPKQRVIAYQIHTDSSSRARLLKACKAACCWTASFVWSSAASLRRREIQPDEAQAR